MPRSANQKLKLLYVMDFLLRESDEAHPVTLARIAEDLAARGVAAGRKSLYDDIETLRAFGLDVIQCGGGRSVGYCVASRDFELPELKLLVDSVQSSRFITRKKTAALIKKIETLTSRYEARELQRQVYVAGRVKTMNESIYYNVDAIHGGISRDRKLRFKYFEFTVDKKRRYRRDGAWYVVSPYALTWDNENYYLVAYDAGTEQIRHYRVDKMSDISALEEPRDGAEAYGALDMGKYAGRVFGMFAGEEIPVRMRFENRLAGAVIDRLGREVMLVPDGDAHFTVTAPVVPSTQFFAWIFGFGAMAEILGPEDVTARMAAQLREVSELYG